MQTEYTDKIKCPYCGDENEDSWEYDDCCGSKIDCGECGEEFRLTVHYQVSYTTNKVEP